MFKQDKANTPKIRIISDSQSTVDVLSNGKLLINICDSKWVLTLYCNAGMAIVAKKGDLNGFGMVGIANILFLHNVQKTYKVTYDSSLITVFVVQKSDDTQHMFKPSKRGYSFPMLSRTFPKY